MPWKNAAIADAGRREGRWVREDKEEEEEEEEAKEEGGGGGGGRRRSRRVVARPRWWRAARPGKLRSRTSFLEIGRRSAAARARYLRERLNLLMEKTAVASWGCLKATRCAVT